MIEYEFYAGEYDDVNRGAASVSMVYWTIHEPDFDGIDDQFIAQFLGLV